MITFIIILMSIVVFFVLFTLWGVSIKNHGMNKLILAEVEADGQKLATTKDGRQVAYCVYGSHQASAPVVINMHGSGLEAGFERATYKNICSTLGCRGISISLPGCGFTDEKPGRQVKDWPAEDLAAVLSAESVSQFHITGHSQGTPHAMASVITFPERCIGLGLNAPLLPTTLCEQLGVGRTLGTGDTLTSDQLKQTKMGWYFAVFWIVFRVLPVRVLSGVIKKGLPKIKADHELVNRIESSMSRAVVRGTNGANWETAQDTCFNWGFDVRELQHKNVCVWHADDDNAIPAEQGRWLAEHLNADYRHVAEGYGHMTYCAGQYLEPEKSLVCALLQGAANKR